MCRICSDVAKQHVFPLMTYHKWTDACNPRFTRHMITLVTQCSRACFPTLYTIINRPECSNVFVCIYALATTVKHLSSSFFLVSHKAPTTTFNQTFHCRFTKLFNVIQIMTLILYAEVMKILLWVSICNNNHSLTRTVIKQKIGRWGWSFHNRNRPVTTRLALSRRRWNNVDEGLIIGWRAANLCVRSTM